MLKKILLVLCSSLLGSALLIFFFSLTLVSTIRPEHLKKWAIESGLYAAVPSSIVSNIQNQSSESLSGAPAQNALLQEATTQALDRPFIQSSGDQIIDGTFRWLDGKTAEPDFSIDVAPLKVRIADNVVTKIKRRYEALPACKPRTLPTSTDPLTIECRPAGAFNIDVELAKVKSELTANTTFLPNNIITASTLKGQGQVSSFETYKNVPKTYQQITLLPLITAVVAIILSSVIILLSKSRARGFRSVGTVFVVNAALAGIGMWFMRFLFTRLTQQLTSKPETNALNTSLVSLANLAQRDVITFGRNIAIGYFVLGISILIGLFLYSRRREANKPLIPVSTTPAPPQQQA